MAFKCHACYASYYPALKGPSCKPVKFRLLLRNMCNKRVCFLQWSSVNSVTYNYIKGSYIPFFEHKMTTSRGFDFSQTQLLVRNFFKHCLFTRENQPTIEKLYKEKYGHWLMDPSNWCLLANIRAVWQYTLDLKQINMRNHYNNVRITIRHKQSPLISAYKYVSESCVR